MGCIKILLWIFIICVFISVMPYIGIFMLAIAAIKMIIKIIKWIVLYRKNKQNDEKVKPSVKETNNSKTEMHNHKYSKQQLEQFMIACNAQIEHDEQMEEYKKYYNIKGDE